jgi:protein farnesyltransferase/geranylgeranyltransferase type-1 subunit alpha
MLMSIGSRQYRYATLLALQKDLKDELDLMNEFARVNLKSYQVWLVNLYFKTTQTKVIWGRHHRLLLTTAISPGSPTDEINYIHNSLLPDPKNYHTWAYLYWIYSHFSTLGRVSDEQWQDELDWCEEMLRVDGRNNSAWGWRWFLRVSRPGATGGEGDGKIEIM